MIGFDKFLRPLMLGEHRAGLCHSHASHALTNYGEESSTSQWRLRAQEPGSDFQATCGVKTYPDTKLRVFPQPEPKSENLPREFGRGSLKQRSKGWPGYNLPEENRGTA